MKKDVFTYIIGGVAGAGVKKAGTAASNLFMKMGRNVFEMDDYQSLIRGGHNFSVVSSAEREISSHYMKADVIVNLDRRSYDLHEEHLAEDGIVVTDKDAFDEGEDHQGILLPLTEKAKSYSRPKLIGGVSGVAVLAAVIGKEKKELEDFVKGEYTKGTEENVAYAGEIYDITKDKIEKRFELSGTDEKKSAISGNSAIALGASAAGLDMYFAYPMTPASSILHFFASNKDELGVVPVHPENEIGVANMAIGATFAGSRTMVGSSGGGTALMEEAFSLAGMTEAPVLFVLASRPGPSTGVPTYTEQADLRFALNQGHGDFPRIVASPGSFDEAFYLAGEMMNILWKFQTPGILLTEKHLSESSSVIDVDPSKVDYAEPEMYDGEDFKRYLDTESGVSPLKFPPYEEVIKWNSYESDERGITTEDPEEVTKMHDKRERKAESILKYMKDMRTVNTYGDEESEDVIFTYGSTTMSVLEALRAGDIDAKVVQPRYLEPLPIWELEKYNDHRVIVVEQSVSGQFATLLRDKINIRSKAVIKKYDGRPFDPVELAEKIKEVI